MNHNHLNAAAVGEKLGASKVSAGRAPWGSSLAVRAAAVIAVLYGLVFSALAEERIYFPAGHGDIVFQYRQSEWEWNFRLDDPAGEHSPKDVVVELGKGSELSIPDDERYLFLGEVGTPVWIISQVYQDAVPYLGLIYAADPPGVFERIVLTLDAASGHGDYYMWMTDGGGQVSVAMNTSDGIDGDDRLNLPASGHIHQALGFTAPGTYFLSLRAEGILSGGDGSVISDPQTYRFAVNVFDRGEIDLEVVWEDGEWELALLQEETEQEFEPGEAVLHAGPRTLSPIPDDPAFEFLGKSGGAVYVLPQDEREGILFLGIAGDEIQQGTFGGDTVSLDLMSVTGPGDVFLYASDSLGGVKKYFDSSDGFSDADRFPVAAGGHAHQAWAFTEPGLYRVGLRASGVLADGGQPSASETTDFLFEVLGPKPFSEGELDLEVVYEDDEWELALLHEETETEYGAGEVVLQAGSRTRSVIPDDPAFGFLGESGAVVYVLPQDEREGILFLGIAGDEIERGLFANDAVALEMTSVTGPGDVFLYASDSLGGVEKYFDSSDGFSDDDRFPVVAGGHAHQAWAFTEPGFYWVGLRASGMLADGNRRVMSEESLFLFEVMGPGGFGEGELDLEVVYEAGEWELALLHEETETEYEADEVVLQARPQTLDLIPADPAFRFLGEPGGAVYVLPQDEREGVLFLGIAGDEIEEGLFAHDEVSLELVSIMGPGDVFLYATDSLGGLLKYFDSSDGLSGADRFPVVAGGHAHQAWAFTEPGFYRVGLQASGVLADGGTRISSEETVFQFEVMKPKEFAEGELDLEVVYEDGEWELALLHEATETEYEADEALLYVGPGTRIPVPDSFAFAFLGQAGNAVYVLPQDEREGVLFLGIAGDEIELGLFAGDAVALDLTSVAGPGDVFLYASDSLGGVKKYFDSSDGLSGADRFPVAAGGHAHQAWAFTEPGFYRIGLQAAGELAGGGQRSESEETFFWFEIKGPEEFGEGELDLEVVYENGEWELVGLDEATEREIPFSDLLIQGDSRTMIPVPDSAAFGFLGSPGAKVYVLPQNEIEGVVFLGLAGDEIETGIFADENVQLRLVGVSGPGAVSLYGIDSLGSPTVYFDSSDGISETDSLTIGVGAHLHRNWGFTRPGEYRLSLQARGKLAASGETVASEVAHLWFRFESDGFALEIGVDGQGVPLLRWPSTAGKNYQIQWKPDGILQDWRDRFDPLVGTGEIMSRSLEEAAGREAYFRVVERQ